MASNEKQDQHVLATIEQIQKEFGIADTRRLLQQVLLKYAAENDPDDKERLQLLLILELFNH